MLNSEALCRDLDKTSCSLEHWRVAAPLQTIHFYILYLIITSAVTIFVLWLHEGHDLKSITVTLHKDGQLAYTGLCSQAPSSIEGPFVERRLWTCSAAAADLCWLPGADMTVCAVARWLCGTLHLALVTVVFHRDANHQACAGGMIKCHTAPLALAITVNKSSSPTGCEGVESAATACAARSVQGHSATHR